jgi:hypothetical protein
LTQAALLEEAAAARGAAIAVNALKGGAGSMVRLQMKHRCQGEQLEAAGSAAAQAAVHGRAAVGAGQFLLKYKVVHIFGGDKNRFTILDSPKEMHIIIIQTAHQFSSQRPGGAGTSFCLAGIDLGL